MLNAFSYGAWLIHESSELYENFTRMGKEGGMVWSLRTVAEAVAVSHPFTRIKIASKTLARRSHISFPYFTFPGYIYFQAKVCRGNSVWRGGKGGGECLMSNNVNYLQNTNYQKKCFKCVSLPFLNTEFCILWFGTINSCFTVFNLVYWKISS